MENEELNTKVKELSETEKHEAKLRKILINKKIKVVPIKRESSWLPVGHDGEFMLTGTVAGFDLPISISTGQRIPILTREEQDVFEKELNLEKGAMSFYDKDKGFWTTKAARVELTKEGITLDLSRPIDYIKWLILKELRVIAPSWKERLHSGAYKFALVDDEETIKEGNTKTELMMQVYRHFGKIEDSPKMMQNVLKLYGKRTSNNDLKFLKAEIQVLIDKNAEEFVQIMSDKHFNLKVMIEQAMEVRAIERTKDGYRLLGGDSIGRTQSEVIEWFENPNNSDLVLNIKGKIDNFEPGK